MGINKNEATDRLFGMILALSDEEECYKFFSDLCTIREINDMSQRIATALLLDEGLNYKEISARTGASTATIGRVSRCLRYGAGGYEKAIEKYRRNNSDDK